MARNKPVIWVGRKQEYFYDGGWTVIPLIFFRQATRHTTREPDHTVNERSFAAARPPIGGGMILFINTGDVT
jgi:hypothetical protein